MEWKFGHDEAIVEMEQRLDCLRSISPEPQVSVIYEDAVIRHFLNICCTDRRNVYEIVLLDLLCRPSLNGLPSGRTLADLSKALVTRIFYAPSEQMRINMETNAEDEMDQQDTEDEISVPAAPLHNEHLALGSYYSVELVNLDLGADEDDWEDGEDIPLFLARLPVSTTLTELEINFESYELAHRDNHRIVQPICECYSVNIIHSAN